MSCIAATSAAPEAEPRPAASIFTSSPFDKKVQTKRCSAVPPRKNSIDNDDIIRIETEEAPRNQKELQIVRHTCKRSMHPPVCLVISSRCIYTRVSPPHPRAHLVVSKPRHDRDTIPSIYRAARRPAYHTAPLSSPPVPITFYVYDMILVRRKRDMLKHRGAEVDGTQLTIRTSRERLLLSVDSPPQRRKHALRYLLVFLSKEQHEEKKTSWGKSLLRDILNTIDLHSDRCFSTHALASACEET